MVKQAIIFITLGVAVSFCLPIQAAPINVSYTVNTNANQTPISKYVYGSNWISVSGYTVRRCGGNRNTAYNWENNWSNAGSDWRFENDQYFGPAVPPGKPMTDFHDQSLSLGQETIMTLQVAGYVSAPIFGEYLNNYPAPSQYFYPVQYAKGAPFCSPPGSPNTSDGVVYIDEFVNFLVSRYGPAGSPQGIKFYSLDNEVDAWQATHYEVHPAKPGAQEVRDKDIACATAVKNVDPNCQIMGPVLCTFEGFKSMGGAPDWPAAGGGKPWFTSYYLDEMKKASDANGMRILDIFDVHWYPPEDDGNGHGICDNINDARVFNARMQAPRTLWDTDYVTPHETYPDGGSSWVNHWWNAAFLPILPRFKADIQNYFPDTNIAITEYTYGPETQWATGITTVDFLGICGKYGVYMTNYWGSGGYVDAAMRIYRNYDGSNSKFGDMNIMALMSNKVDSSIYGALSSTNPDVLHLIVLNKNQTDSINGTFTITSSRNYTSGTVWAFDNNSANITQRTSIGNITNNTFTYTIPKTSAYHIILTSPSCPAYDLTGDCHMGFDDLSALIGTAEYNLWLYQLSPEEIDWCSTYPTCPDLNHDAIIDALDFALLAQEWGM